MKVKKLTASFPLTLRARRIMLTMLLIGILTSAISIQQVNSSGTIYIRPDGSIDPPDAPIQRNGDLYTFTYNIYDEIVVERDNIVVDGAGHTLQGTGAWNSKGIYLTGRSNVTIKNTEIEAFYYAIYIMYSSNNKISGGNLANNHIAIWLGEQSPYNTVSRNKITNNDMGICLDACQYNTISGNNITNNTSQGIYGQFHPVGGNNNIISGNNITANGSGIQLYENKGNVISHNNIVDNNHGIEFMHDPILGDCVGITLYHNNIIDNGVQAYDPSSADNDWHHPVLLEGNYWSDYTGVDDGSGTGKHAIAGDGIGDTDIPWPNTDYDFYPFVEESGWGKTVETTEETGDRKDVFDISETVFISGRGYTPSTSYDLYVVEDTTWVDDMNIPDRVSGTETSLTTDEKGDIPIGTVAWNGQLTPGKYDIVIDVNGNGKYDDEVDALDDEDIEVTAGFFVIPELPIGTLMGIITCLVALATFRFKRINIKH